MCRFYEVSRAGYYKWRHREPSARDKEDEVLLEQIQVIHRQSRGIYGSPRIHAGLRDQGWCIGKKRVARLMQIDSIRGRSADLYYASPGLDHHYGDIPNRKRNVTVTKPNPVWTGDITYLKLGSQWLYLAVVMDLFSRRIIGWALGRHKAAALTLKALN